MQTHCEKYQKHLQYGAHINHSRYFPLIWPVRQTVSSSRSQMHADESGGRYTPKGDVGVKASRMPRTTVAPVGPGKMARCCCLCNRCIRSVYFRKKYNYAPHGKGNSARVRLIRARGLARCALFPGHGVKPETASKMETKKTLKRCIYHFQSSER